MLYDENDFYLVWCGVVWCGVVTGGMVKGKDV